LRISPSAVSKTIKKLSAGSHKYFGGKVARWQEQLIQKGQ
jgi:hypothetical protein